MSPSSSSYMPPSYMPPSHMQEALALAARAEAFGEVPVGAVITDARGEIIARSYNQMRARHDATAHAEILAIRAASVVLGNERLSECALYVTLEPCFMCAGAIALARIKRLYYAASDPKSGAIEHGRDYFNQPHCHHRPEIYDGIGATQARAMLTRFFVARRK